MAVIKDRKTVYYEEIKRLNALVTKVHERLKLLQEGKAGRCRCEMALMQPDSLEVDPEIPTSSEELMAKLTKLTQTVEDLQRKISLEDEKMKNWKVRSIV